MNRIQKKIWDINLVIDEIIAFPQTYETILKEMKNNGTYQTILRRKLNNLVKDGVICKLQIPGTRFGKALFYAIPKKYYILIESTRMGSKVYVFKKYRKISTFYLETDECSLLKKGKWCTIYSKQFSEGNILKFI